MFRSDLSPPLYHNLLREAAYLSEVLLDFYQITFCIKAEDLHRFQSRIIARREGVKGASWNYYYFASTRLSKTRL